jgi:hypothetical protein
MAAAGLNPGSKSSAPLKPSLKIQPFVCHGGGGQNRTDDPLLAKQMLSQLSYAPDNGGPGKT